MEKFNWDQQRDDWAAAPAELDAGKISFRRMDHGKAFRVAMQSSQFLIDGYLSFDVWTDRFILVSLDDQIGQIDVQQGVFAGDRLVLDNLKADTIYKQRAKTIHTRLELHFVQGHLSAMRIDSSHDQGKSWKPTSLFSVKRVAEVK